MPTIAVHELSLEELRNLGAMREPVYNGFDNCMTFEIDQARQNLRRNDTLIYDFERCMQAPALEMMLRGFRVDIFERDDAIAKLRKRKENTERILSALIDAVSGNYSSKFPNSPKQLQELLYDTMKLKPIETHRNGETKRPMNREVLERLETQDKFAAPIINGVLFYRDLSKSLQVLETDIDNDWRWRCSYNIGGTSTGRWSSSKSPLGTGCVLPHVEALTPEGWKRLDRLQDSDIIMQWNPNTDSLEWSSCSIYSQQFDGYMLRAETEQVLQTLTPNHRVARYDINLRNLYTEQAEHVSQLSQVAIPLGSRFSSGENEVPQYVAMLMADFSEEQPNYWRAIFKKERKIERLISLAKQFNLNIEENLYNKDGYRRFTIRTNERFPKKWGPWILDLTPESASDLLEEARYWDSHDRGSGFIFFTKDKEQAEWFVILAHIASKSATMRLVYQNEGSYSTTPIWWVNVKARSHARVYRKHWSKVRYSGTVYCPSVRSSYWLMREEGFVSITGNSNFQNINEELRRVFIPDPGYKLYGIDKAQSEARDVGWFCGVVLGDWSYLDACESGDLHTHVTRLCYPEWSWTGDLKKDREIAERRFYRFFTYRDVSKRVGHATNYLGSPNEISRQTRLPLHIAKDFQDRYFSAFPCILRMHTWIAQFLQRNKYLINSFGRRRDFFDRTDTNETIKSAVAYMFQSATGDCVNLGLYRLWKHMGNRIQILSQLHDAVYFQAKIPTNDSEEKKLIRDALDLIEIEQRDPKSGRTMKIPGEAVGGFNWSHRYRIRADGSLEDWNPKGLDKIRA